MVIIIKLTQDIGDCNEPIQNCFVHPNGWTVTSEILNLHLVSDDSSNEIENKILKNRTCTFKGVDFF